MHKRFLRFVLCLLALPACLDSAPPEFDIATEQSEMVVSVDFDPVAGGFVVTCDDGRVETYPIGGLDLANACLPPEPPNRVTDLFGFQGIFCATYESGALHCWAANDDVLSQGRANHPSLVGEMSNIDMGFMSACGLDDQHGVRCWGNNERKQLNIPAEFTAPGAARDLSVGEDYVCVLRADGFEPGNELECWGTYGVTDLNLELPANLAPIRQIESVGGSLCVVFEDDSLECYGAYPARPAIPEGRRVRELYTNKIVACAVLDDDKLSCFTDGNPAFNPITANVPDVAFSDISDIAIGDRTACILRSNGLNKECFGDVNSGENIYPDAAQKATKVVIGDREYCALQPNGELLCWSFGGTPFDPFPGHAAEHIVAGAASACSIDAEGKTTCWGRRDAVLTQWGLSTLFDIDTQLDIENAPYVRGPQSISLGEDHSCFLQQGYLQCRGNDYAGQGSLHGPADVLINRVIVSGLHHNCVIREDDQVVCWGDNALGQTRLPATLPTASAIDAGANHTCIVSTDGEAVCWGDSSFGQARVPAELGTVTAVAAGRAHSCALTEAGAVSCWGDNALGQLDVPAFSSAVASLEAGFDHTCAILADDTFTCWGSDEYRQLLKPIGLTKVSALAAGDGFTCAIGKADQQVECWGRDTEGQTRVPAEVGLDFSRQRSVANGTRVMHGANLFTRKEFGTVSVVENFGGAVFEYAGIDSAAGNALGYDVRVRYTADCQTVSRQNIDFGIQARSPATATYLTRKLSGFRGSGTVEFQNLRGLSELSFSVGNLDFAEPDQAFVAELGIDPDDRCSFRIDAVNVIPTTTALEVLGEGATELTQQLEDSFADWLRARTDRSFAEDELPGKLAEIDVQKQRIVERAQNALFSDEFFYEPADFDLVAFDEPTVVAGLFAPVETLLPGPDNALTEPVDIQWPLGDADRAEWFDYLEDIYIASLNTDVAELLFEQLLSYRGSLEVVIQGTEDIASERSARERLDGVVARVEAFLRQSDYLKGSLNDEVELQIDRLFDVAIEKKSGICLDGVSEGTVAEAGCQ